MKLNAVLETQNDFQTAKSEAPKTEETALPVDGADQEEAPPIEEYIRELVQDELQISDEAKSIMDRSVTDLFNFEENSKPEDNTSVLTKRLVAAKGQMEVRQVLGEASRAWVQLRRIASMSSGENAELARKYVKKVEKLMKRARKKIDDLGNEDHMKIQQKRMEQQEKLERAAEIEKELRKEFLKRKERERGYLLEDIQDKLQAIAGQKASLDPATEAKIAAEARAAAAAEAAAAATGADGVSSDAGSPAAGGEPSVGAEGAGAAPAVGSVDFAV